MKEVANTNLDWTTWSSMFELMTGQDIDGRAFYVSELNSMIEQFYNGLDWNSEDPDDKSWFAAINRERAKLLKVHDAVRF